jgi:hypothetical protein
VRPSELLPGFCAGLARVAVSYPVDYVRTRQQAGNVKLRAAWLSVVNIRQLYCGASLSFVSVPCERAVQFAAFEHGNQRGYGPFGSALIGAAAATTVSGLVQPILAQRIVHGASLVEALRRMRAMPAAVGRGTVVELLRAGIGATIYLYMYGRFRAASDGTRAHGAVAGVGASMTTILATYPLETLRIRVHAGTAAMHGLCGLYKGVGLAIVRTVPSAAFGMWVYETVRAAVTATSAGT